MLPSISILKSISSEIANVAQKIYDEWQQDEEGNDEEYGGGGICHDIADAIVEVLSNHNIEAHSVSQTIGEVHVYTVAKFQEGVYSIDIPPSIYESGYAYTWKKKPNIKFDSSHIAVDLIDKNPNSFEEYLGESFTFKKFVMFKKKETSLPMIRRNWPAL